MVVLLVEPPMATLTITIPLSHLLHYCGPRYHVGWLAGLGYVAAHAEGTVHRAQDDSVMDVSLAVKDEDVLKFIYSRPATLRCTNLRNGCTGRDASSSSSASSVNSRKTTDDVFERDSACVFSGKEVALQKVHILPAKVYSWGRFHEVADILGLERIGELQNLLTMLTLGANELDQGTVSILASDARFVPLAYLQELEASKTALESRRSMASGMNADIPLHGGVEAHFQLFFQHISGIRPQLRDLLCLNGLHHYALAHFPPTAFIKPRSVPAREVYHHMYWGRMISLYCDPQAQAYIKRVDAVIPPCIDPGDPHCDGGPGSGGGGRHGVKRRAEYDE